MRLFMYCDRCGKQVEENSRFCGICGNEIKGNTKHIQKKIQFSGNMKQLSKSEY